MPSITPTEQVDSSEPSSILLVMTRDPAKSAAKTADIVAAANAIAARLNSAEARARLAEAAAASKIRSRELVGSVKVDPPFLARRVTF